MASVDGARRGRPRDPCLGGGDLELTYGKVESTVSSFDGWIESLGLNGV